MVTAIGVILVGTVIVCLAFIIFGPLFGKEVRLNVSHDVAVSRAIYPLYCDHPLRCTMKLNELSAVLYIRTVAKYPPVPHPPRQNNDLKTISTSM